ncbi:MAG: globin, partial [Planctomycetota bacterium]
MHDPVNQIVNLIGEPTIRQMVSAFYTHVRNDDLIGPMYPPNDWEGAEQRLADFLVYRFGGDDAYLQRRGHPRLRGRHMGFPIDAQAAQRWLQLMGRAMRETDIAQQHQVTMKAF